MMVRGVGAASVPQAGASRPGGSSSGFAVRTTVNTPPGTSGVAPAAGLDGLLLLQEVEGSVARDRRARRHGRAMLDALARLQLGLLGDEGDEAALGLLSTLVEHCPEAADPGLRDLLGAVALRALVEVARRKV